MQKPAPAYVADLVFHPEHDTLYVHFENAAAHPFQPDPAGFPRVNAWWLADSALLTYWDEVKAAAIFKSAGLHSTFIKVRSTDCYVAWQNTFVIVAFRGTQPDEWDDMLTDANIVLVPWHAGLVHCGFKTALDDIWPKLMTELNAVSAGRSVWFCGHSLGAALTGPRPMRSGCGTTVTRAANADFTLMWREPCRVREASQRGAPAAHACAVGCRGSPHVMESALQQIEECFNLKHISCGRLAFAPCDPTHGRFKPRTAYECGCPRYETTA